jgi:copper chaperone NosL
MGRIIRQTAGLSLFILAACRTPGPRPIAYWTEACEHCHMTIADPRFAAQLVTHTGLIYSFDDPACLATFMNAGSVPAGRVSSIWVSEFLHPDRMVDGRSASYLRRPGLSTPMASGLAAFSTRAEADSVRVAEGGTIMTWAEVRAASWRHNGASPHTPAAETPSR